MSLYRRRNVPLELRLADLHRLTSAGSAAELAAALVLGPPGVFEREVTLAYGCFRRVHDHDRADAVRTALLLVTDPRWTPAAGPLMARLEETGLIPEEHLDLLAETFLAAGAHVWWECPDEWFTGPTITIDLEAGTWIDVPDADSESGEAEDLAAGGGTAGQGAHEAGHQRHEEAGDLTGDLEDQEASPAMVARAVHPALRRWATRRAVTITPARWPALLEHARAQRAPDGAAIVRGLLDAADALNPAAVELVREAALRWGQADVRLAAMRSLAAEDPDAARRLAAKDPNGRVRRLTRELAEPPLDPTLADPDTSGEPSARATSAPTQPSLL